MVEACSRVNGTAIGESGSGSVAASGSGGRAGAARQCDAARRSKRPSPLPRTRPLRYEGESERDAL